MDTTLRDPLVGQVLDGRYHVESRIASGGMATVYLALDRRLDREVALKVLHPDLAADPEFVQRFVREARSAARLSHPNVVQVFDQGSDGDRLYLAMEYLPGRTLRDVIGERGALTPREALSVLEPMLDALGAAHRAGFMHRDVKPENVILTNDGRIKVADFGLARAARSPVGPATTTGNRLLGTAGYLAPELVGRGVADARADVYAAGVVLFEMLTGRQPFTGPDPVTVAYRHVHETVPPPSLLAPELPAELDDLVLSATAHDPDDRPASAEQLLAAVRRAHTDLPPDVLDLRAPVPAPAPPASGTATQLINGPAAHRATQALLLPDDAGRAGTEPEPSGLGRLVPRLQVHEDDGGPPPSRPLRGTDGRNRLLVIAALALALLVAAAVWWTTIGPGAYQRTPETVGEKQAVAEQILHQNGLRDTVRTVFSSTVAAGLVVSSDPAAGEHLRKGGTVTLNVSKGPDTVAVPKVTGLSRDDAVGALRRARLTPGDITGAYSADVDKGKVVSTTPDVGQKVSIGSTVSLVVSKGPKPVELPNLTTQSLERARSQLTALGLQVEVTRVNAGPVPANVVVAQDPAAGSSVHPGDTVMLTVTEATATVPPPDQRPMVDVPDVTGHDYDQAAEKLTEKGFQVRRLAIVPFGSRVVSQSPGGHSQAPQGSTVILYTAF